MMVITIWKDGSWKMWGAVDAIYAQADPDFLVNIGVDEIKECEAKGGTDAVAAAS